MNTITVYQADADGFFLYESKASELALDPGHFNVPFGAVPAEPPSVSSGQVARLMNGEWTVVEDHRSDMLYVIATGASYQVGTNVHGQSYDGGGPIPVWLTDVQPAPADSVEDIEGDAAKSAAV